MNVIVSNRQKEIIDNANIDAIKDLNGLFNVDDLINKFKNYFFSKMILDATSIINFASRDVLAKLAKEIGGDKLVILLPNSPEPPIEFKKLLVDLGIYNFSNNIADVVNYLEKPNTYENVMNAIMNSFNGSGFYVDNSIRDNSASNNQFNSSNNMDNNVDDSNNDNINVFNHGVNENNFSTTNNTNQFGNSLGDNLASMNINQNINNNLEQHDNLIENNANILNVNQSTTHGQYINKYDENLNLSIDNQENANNIIGNNKYEDVVEENIYSSNNQENNNQNLVNFYENNGGSVANKFIIGVKNITEHAGSTTLVYLLRKLADVKMKKNACAFEIGKNDFKFFHDDKLYSVEENMILNAIKSVDSDIIFVDLNSCKDISFCNAVLFLLEPSIIKLNKLMAESKFIFKSLINKRVILNKSLLSSNDVKALANEAGIEIFYNLEPLNDRISNNSVIKLLDLLNIK